MARNCAFFGCGDKISRDRVVIQNFSLSQGQFPMIFGVPDLDWFNFGRNERLWALKWTMARGCYGEVARLARVSPGAPAFWPSGTGDS